MGEQPPFYTTLSLSKGPLPQLLQVGANPVPVQKRFNMALTPSGPAQGGNMLGKDKFFSGETVSQLAERLQTNRKQLRQRSDQIEQSDLAGDGEQQDQPGKRFVALHWSGYA